MYIHQQGRVHGCLRSDSVIVDDEGSIKVMYPGPKRTPTCN